jgi:hypothetical protein
MPGEEMKDYKAECDKLRGELTEVRRMLEKEREERFRRQEQDREVRDKFKELLINVLGR